MSFKKGDRVKLSYKDVTGVIKSIKYQGAWALHYPSKFLIEYDDMDLIPPEQWHDESDLILLESLPEGASTLGGLSSSECECGAQYDRNFPNIHSEWCKKYKK